MKIVNPPMNTRCPHCGKFVGPIPGGGIRFHCPHCLYAIHKCDGLMEPRGILLTSSGYKVLLACMKCGEVAHDKACPDDSFEQLLLISQKSMP